MEPSSAAMLGSAAIGGVSSAMGAQKANAAAKKMLKYQLQFAHQGRLNAHQWAADDMEKAGLNRILSINSAASSPSPGGVPTMQNEGAGISEAINAGVSAFSAKERAKVERDLAENTVKKTKEEINTLKKEQKVKDATTQQIKVNTQHSAQDLHRAKVKGELWQGVNKVIDGGINSAKSRAPIPKFMEYVKKRSKPTKKTKKAMDKINSISNPWRQK